MIEWIFSSCVLILIVLLVRQVFKNKVSACFRYGLWLIVMVRLLIPFSLPGNSLSVLNILQTEENTMLTGEMTDSAYLDSLNRDNSIQQDNIGELNHAIEQDNAGDQGIADGQSSVVEQADGFNTAESIIMQDTFFEENQQLLVSQNENSNSGMKDTLGDSSNIQTLKPYHTKILYAIWLVGAGICTIVLFTSNFVFSKRLKKTGIKVDGEMTINSHLPVYQSTIISSPCMFGILKPAIYLNTEHIGEGILHILQHENTHYKHKDHIWSFLRSICLILHWYNPLVWLSVYLSMKDAEFACDESVIKNYSDEARKDYGKTLIALTVKQSPSLALLSCASTLSGGNGYMKERIKRIAKSPKYFVLPVVLVVLICTVAVVITFTGSKEENNDNNADNSNTSLSANSESPEIKMSDEEEVQNAAISAKPDDFAENQQEYKGKSVFLNDHLLDINGDGIKDVIRINAITETEEYTTIELDSEETLSNWLNNADYYYEVVIYDGSKIFTGEETFEKGMPLREESIVSSGESRIYAYNVDRSEREYLPQDKIQLSYYEEDGKVYLVSNLVEMVDGYGYYHYFITSCSEDWESELVVNESLTFSVNSEFNPIVGSEFKNYSHFAYKHFNYNDILTYTLELEKYLQKSTVLIDTINDVSTTPIWYEETVRTPNVYDIWNWNPVFDGVMSYDEFKPLMLEYSESVWRKIAGEGFVTYEALEYRGWPVWGMDVSFHYVNSPEVIEPAYEYADILVEYWDKLPDNAKNLSAKVVELVCEDKVISNDSIWSDWRITEIEWVGTYYLDGNPLDIYSYDYLYKLDESLDREDEEVADTILWWEEQEDGWFAYNYLMDFVVYDRNQDLYFLQGTNDGYPGDNTFTSDLIIYYKENYLGGFSYTDPENRENKGE